jgi:predicted TIM-barrel fold metal-dependent hydrolase
MDRRNFLSVMPGLYPLTLLSNPFSNPGPGPLRIPDELDRIPNFCTHEHWGSVASIGHAPGMFNADMIAGALPNIPTSLFHLLVDPYMSGNLLGAGKHPGKYRSGENSTVDLAELAKESPTEALKILVPLLKENRLTGTFLTTRLGIEHLYDGRLDLENVSMMEELNESIAANYTSLFDWYELTMQRVGFTGLIRPVHPEFFFTIDNEDARHELSFTRTVMRIDPLLSFWEDSDRKEQLFEKVGQQARDAASWRSFLEKLITVARERGCVGIKQLQGYMRHLDFEKPGDGEVKFGGKLTEGEQIIFQNWVVNECSRLANELNWPHQIHVGTHNMPESNPLPLQILARNYPKQKIVQLHCWPYQREAGHLAKSYPNIYIDTCWQVVLNPAFLKESMAQWLHYVPLSKITMGNDSTSIEMAVGSSLISRTVLMESLDRHLSAWYIDGQKKMDIVYDFMHNNAVDVYGYGEKLSPVAFGT